MSFFMKYALGRIAEEPEDRPRRNKPSQRPTIDSTAGPSRPATRGRATELESENDRLKAELAALKTAKSQSAASTSASRLRANNLEQQNARLLSEMEALKAARTGTATRLLADENARKAADAMSKLNAMKSRLERASVARASEVKTLLMKSFMLDLLFLVDVTGSMSPSISMVRDKIGFILQQIRKTHPRTSLRVAFIGYRDYHDGGEEDSGFVTLSQGKDGMSVTATTTAMEQFRRFMSTVHASGGDDAAEDVFSGLEAAGNASWNKAGSRLLVHIADAPCHGLAFHNGACHDDYPQGDKYGRSAAQPQLLKKLKIDCNIQAYYFVHLNDSTNRMVQIFKEIIGSEWIHEMKNISLETLPEKIAFASVQTISTALADGIKGGDSGFVPLAINNRKPDWSRVATFHASAKRMINMDVDETVQAIKMKEPFGFEEFATMDIKIAPQPFSNEGAARWPYYAKVLKNSIHSKITDFVVKRFKAPLNKPLDEVHRKSRYVEQAEVQTVCAAFARVFNRAAEGAPDIKPISFTQVSLLEVRKGDEPTWYNIEKELNGEFIKYSNNAGYVNTKEYQSTLQAFTHWSHSYSGGAMMITDLQGILDHEADKFWLCDPAIHASGDLLRFGKTNLGEEGCKLFFESHSCNRICRHLGLH